MFLIAACSTLAKKMYSIKNPKFKTYDIQKSVLKNKSVDDQTVHYKDSNRT